MLWEALPIPHNVVDNQHMYGYNDVKVVVTSYTLTWKQLFRG